jgi:hypothetical protein
VKRHAAALPGGHRRLLLDLVDAPEQMDALAGPLNARVVDAVSGCARPSALAA